MRTPLQSFLIKHAAKSPVSFHMPGHKGLAIYKNYGYGEFLNQFVNCDVTEIAGADNLFQAEGIIKEVQEHYAQLYEVNQSYLLVNGTSGGIIASILACVNKGKKLIMARNCHKSVFNALTLGDIQPVYAYPEHNKEFGISGPISPEEIDRLLSENDDADAVILPSPNYYGICSNIKAIGDIVHKHGKVLIVDQAHGAHLKFFEKAGITGLPQSAETAGADLIVNSTHKTLASLTQSAVLNLNSNRVDPLVLEDKLQCIQSTSPSYLLMGSLDINAAILKEHGNQIMKRWAANMDSFYREAQTIPGLTFIDRIPGLDWTKLNLSMAGAGVSGAKLEAILMNRFQIFIELYTGNLVMCMTGMGTSASDIHRLLAGLREISNKLIQSGTQLKEVAPVKIPVFEPAKLCEIPKERKALMLSDAVGHICASSIIPYPPGIPIVCPGEVITAEMAAYIGELRAAGEKVIGMTKEGAVFVGK